MVNTFSAFRSSKQHRNNLNIIKSRSSMTDQEKREIVRKWSLNARVLRPISRDNVVAAMQGLRTQRPCSGDRAEAIWARDLLLLGLFVSNPLRVRVLKELTYKPDGTGHLRKTPLGDWRIVIRSYEVGGSRNGAKEDHDMQVHDSLWPHIERYLARYRKILGGARPELVFVSAAKPDCEWSGVSGRIKSLISNYASGNPGATPNDIRGAVATSMIRKTGGFSLAAKALRDATATIKRHYSRLLASAFQRRR